MFYKHPFRHVYVEVINENAKIVLSDSDIYKVGEPRIINFSWIVISDEEMKQLFKIETFR
jgi:hypothetical protein